MLVIEQYSIATTPKYNFPHPTMDTMMPKRFIESSLQSLTHAQSHPLQLNQQGFQQANNIEVHPQAARLRLPPLTLKPRHAETMVAAVDTSTIKIGETNAGILIAIRGAAVWKESRNYRYTRLGPFVFHITEENKRDVYQTLERAYFSPSTGHDHYGCPGLWQMPTRMAGLLERWLQAMLAKTVDKGLLLFDGSLTAGTPDTSVHLLKEILSTARSRSSLILAFSKMTTLRVNGRLITDLPSDFKSPYLLEMEGLKLKPPTVLLGDVYVAKLAHGGYAFRLDIDREATVEQRVWSVEKLLTNDLLLQGYPETLRLAHILCTFTANEVIAMQHFTTRKHGLRIVNRPDMHSLLFGPFGKGECYA